LLARRSSGDSRRRLSVATRHAREVVTVALVLHALAEQGGEAHASPRSFAHHSRNDGSEGTWRSRCASQPCNGPGRSHSMRLSRDNGLAPRRASFCARS